MEKAAAKGVKIHLPFDVIAGDRFSAEANVQTFPAGEIPQGWMGLDIGPKTQIAYSFVIMQARTIIWNGPMGVFEIPAFASGTLEIGQAVADATRDGAYSLVGGGDSVAAVKKMKLERKVSYVSTGGGAMLEALEGKTLPGVKAIED
jgi:phosphoglycerate kinase